MGTIGAPVSEDHYKLALLRSLPHSYESLVITLENLLDTLCVGDIHARIIREVSCKGKTETEDDIVVSEERLLQARDRFYTYCSKKGHTKNYCWKLKGKGRPRVLLVTTRNTMITLKEITATHFLLAITIKLNRSCGTLI